MYYIYGQKKKLSNLRENFDNVPIFTYVASACVVPEKIQEINRQQMFEIYLE